MKLLEILQSSESQQSWKRQYHAASLSTYCWPNTGRLQPEMEGGGSTGEEIRPRTALPFPFFLARQDPELNSPGSAGVHTRLPEGSCRVGESARRAPSLRAVQEENGQHLKPLASMAGLGCIWSGAAAEGAMQGSGAFQRA